MSWHDLFMIKLTTKRQFERSEQNMKPAECDMKVIHEKNILLISKDGKK